MSIQIDVVQPSSQPAASYERAVWRVVIQPPGDGAMNMATDEAILENVAAGNSPPTLRFFGWRPACLSLGQAQPVADVDMARLKAKGWDLVRRITGGRAILHGDELTYSIVVPQNDPHVAGGVLESYRRLSMGLLAGLHKLGSRASSNVQPHTGSADSVEAQGPVCFEVPSNYEITALGKKLVGSAQTRRKKVVLQHGSLPLKGDLSRICDALIFESEEARAQASERVLTRAITLSDALGKPVSMVRAVGAMMAGFASALNLELEEGQLSEEEQLCARELCTEKYAFEEWTTRH